MCKAPWGCRSCLHRTIRLTLNSGRGVIPPLSRRWASHDSKSLHPALLKRARDVAAEHETLTASLQTSYDTQVASRIGDISSVASALREWDQAQASIVELRPLVSSSDAELRHLATDELDATTAQLGSLARTLSASLAPKHPFNDLPCLIEIHPGPGGLEGRFFADSLLRMYKQFCSRERIPNQLVSYDLADGAGGTSGSDGESPLLEAVLEVPVPGAYGRFRTEAGMHRVQRVPSTEKQGRTHTSAVAIWVLPSFPETGAESINPNDPGSDFYLNPQEVKIEAMRARGAGGQHVNKTESAIRMTHTPTGIVVSIQDDRSKARNREAAWKLLRSRVASKRREAREEEAEKLRDSVLARNRITRSDKIRTYNFAQDRCTDHRSGLTIHNLADVMEGGDGLARVMANVEEWLVGRDIEAMIAEEEAKARKL